jgi:hypothetical protein
MMPNVFAVLSFLALCAAVMAIVALLILRRQPVAPVAAAPPQVAPLPPTALLPEPPPPPVKPPPRTREARRAHDRLLERSVEAQEQIATELAALGEHMEQVAKQLSALQARARATPPPPPAAATRKTGAIETFSPPAGPHVDGAQTDRAMPVFPIPPQHNGVR